MIKETDRKIWSLWGVGLGSIYAISTMVTGGQGITYALGIVLGAWIMTMYLHTAHYFLYARKGLNPDQKPTSRIAKTILYAWFIPFLVLGAVLSLVFAK